MTKIIIALAILFPSIALAATTGLSVSRFEVSATAGQVVSESVWVKNTDTIAQNYVLSVDEDDLDENISIVPNEFALEPGQSKKVAMRLRAPEKSSRAFVSLIANDSNQSAKFSVANGIKLPIDFTIERIAGTSDFLADVAVAPYGAGGKIPLVQYFVWIIDAVVLCAFVYARRRKKLRRMPVEIERFLNDV